MRRNIRICGIIILIALFLSCMLRISQVIQELPKTFYLKLPYVFVHIDLKGAPPKLDYLQSILKRLKSFGANGLLMEYEDMFPYEGNLANIRARNCYKKIQLKEFLLAAIKSNFQIIPLIPTFGNMEYVLKLKEFQHLCEMPLYCDVICPSHNETKILIRDMLKQVIDFHNSIRPLKYIHIGGSDVYDIKTCSVCRLRNLTKTDLYVSHITSVAEIVQDLNPGIKVLFWDDIIRNQMKAKEWANITSEKGLEPVYLDSRKKFAISHFSLHRYHYKFNNIWIASAFKGADSRTATLPNIQDRFENNFNWMNLIVDYKFDGADQVFIFKGIILTGRSRHSHFDPPCELLPASMPSLVLNLLMVQKFKKGVINKKVDARQFYHRYLKNDAEKNVFMFSLHR